MKKIFTFSCRQEFRLWLNQNHDHHEGIWVRFDKRKVMRTFSAEEALEEALCYGWIDSTIQRIDENFYIKYFAKRKTQSIWSEKNQMIVKRLIEKGAMTKHGFKAIEIAKSQGLWGKTYKEEDQHQLALFLALVKPNEEAYKNLLAMPISIQKTYARHYFSAKLDATKKKRLKEITERLSLNLKPM